MPETSVLYSVTGAVVVGLVAWVAFVLKGAKEPWARETPKPVRTAGDDVPVEGAAGAESSKASSLPPSSSLPKVVAGSAGGAGADTTAEATAVVVAKKPDADADVKADADADVKAVDAK